MSKQFYERHNNEDFSFEGLEWVSKDLFEKCYNRALELAEKEGVNIDEYHGVILTQLCNSLRSARRSRTPYSDVSTRLANSIKTIKEDTIRVESLNNILNEVYYIDDRNYNIEVLNYILNYVHNKLGDYEYKIFYTYIMDEINLNVIAKMFNISTAKLSRIIREGKRWSRWAVRDRGLWLWYNEYFG